MPSRVRGYVTDVPYVRSFIRELAPAWLDHVAFIQGSVPPARKQGFTWCERLWLDQPAAVTVVTAAGPDVNYSIVRAGNSRSWSYRKGEKAMSKSKPQSKSKPVNNGTRISSADALAKGAGTELSESLS